MKNPSIYFDTLGAKLDESHEEAIDVITNVLRDVSANEQLAYQPHSPGSDPLDPRPPLNHFEELKSKQMHEQSKFHQKLMHELEIERNKPSSVSNKSSEKKFYNVDAIQDEPVPVQVLDPLQKSPAIPRKRHESSNSDKVVFEFSAPGPFDPSNPNPRNRHESFNPYPRQRHESTESNPRQRHESSNPPNLRQRHESSDPPNPRFRHESSDPRKRPDQGFDPYQRPRHESCSNPAPRQRHLSSDQNQNSAFFRRGSVEHDDENNSSRFRSNSLPRGGKQPLLRPWLNWTGSLTRPGNKKSVKFDDQPPARPPPPAPERQESLKYKLNHLAPLRSINQDHDSDDNPAKLDPFGRHFRDPWVEMYGKAVLDNSLQDRIESRMEARRLKALHSSPVQQYVIEQDQAEEPISTNNGGINSTTEINNAGHATSVLAPPARNVNSTTEINNAGHATPEFTPPPAHNDSHAYAIVRDIVISILKSQGVPNPSEEVVDKAIKDHLNQKVSSTTITAKNCIQ